YGRKERRGTLWRGYAHGPQQDALGVLAEHRTASPPHLRGEGGSQTQDRTTAAEPPRAGAIGDGAAPYRVWSGGGPGEGFLAGTRRCNRGRVRRELQMPEDFPDHLAVRDGRDAPQ